MKNLLLVLAMIIGITFLTNCTKQQITVEEEEQNYPVIPITKDLTVTDILLSELVDTVIKYNELQQHYNLIIEDFIIMDSVKFTSTVFNPDDYVTFNDINTGIDELKSTYENLKANIKFLQNDTISNTFHLATAFNYDGQGGLNPEINEIIADNPIPVDTFNIKNGIFAEEFGVLFQLNIETTIIDITDAVLTKEYMNNLFYDYGEFPDFQIIEPTENLATIQQNDTLTWAVAKHTFDLQENITYFNNQNQAYILTSILSTYSSAFIIAMLSHYPENYPNTIFLFSDSTHIPDEYLVFID